MKKLCIDSYKSKEFGFTLIELMISLLLTSLLTLGAATLYGQSKRSSYYDEQSALIQENARYILSLLGREIAMSGYSAGILDLSSATAGTVATDCGVSWVLNPRVAMEFVNNVTDTVDSTYSCVADDETINGTDLLTIKRTADSATVEDGSFVSGTSALNADQWYMRVENSGNDVQILLGSAVDAGKDLVAGSGVDLWQYTASVYFISPNSVGSDGMPTLCVERLATTGMDKQCLIEGVQNMQLEFGLDIDSDGYPERYVQDPTAADMENAVTIRLYLLMRSPYTVPDYEDIKSYSFGGIDLAAPGDKYIRRVHTTTIKIRNVRKLT